MKTYRHFENEMEARLCAGLLNANGIQTNIVGAREYSSIVSGAQQGHYDLLLHEGDFQKADAVLSLIGGEAEKG